MKPRKFKPSDTPGLVDLFYGTVHTVNAADYSPEQLAAWAPRDERDAKIADWGDSLSRNVTYVAELDSVLAGFGDLTSAGYLNRLYVHKDFQGQGVASALVQALEEEARKLKLEEIYTDASITARPFFERRGYRTVQMQTVERMGVQLVNYRMVKSVSR